MVVAIPFSRWLPRPFWVDCNPGDVYTRYTIIDRHANASPSNAHCHYNPDINIHARAIGLSETAR